jgi:hypothetical protein
MVAGILGVVNRRSSWAVMAVAMICAAGLAAATRAALADSKPTPDDLRPCSTRGDSSRPAKPPAAGTITVGPLVIWPSVRQLAPPPNGTAWPYVWKAPILVRARAQVTLAIAPEAVGKAGLWRHRDGRYVSAVRFLACRERQPVRTYRGTVGKFTEFPFAVALTTPSACLPMDVWVGGADDPQRVVIPVGKTTC